MIPKIPNVTEFPMSSEAWSCYLFQLNISHLQGTAVNSTSLKSWLGRTEMITKA